MDFEKLSRRTFIKKTTVATTGVAALGIFSGLVNAAEDYNYNDCPIVKMMNEIPIPGRPAIPIFECTPGPKICNDKVKCGKMFSFDAITGEPKKDASGKVIWFDVQVDCADREDDSGVFCYREPLIA